MPRQKSRTQEWEAGEKDEMMTAIEFGMTSIRELVQNLCALGTQEQKDENSRKLEEKYKELIKALLVHQKSAQIVDEVVEEVEVDNDRATETEVLAACEQIGVLSKQRVDAYAASIEEHDIVGHPLFQEFQRVLQETMRGKAASIAEASTDEESGDSDNGNESAEDVEGESSNKRVLPTLDPITKNPLTDPVMNKHCSHIYGKAALLQLMERNTKLRCLQPGCSNTKFLKPSDLVEVDAKTAKAIKSNRTKAAGKRNKR